MTYAQFDSGLKLHIVHEAGEEHNGQIVRAGYLSSPICGAKRGGPYRMTINVPLAHACGNCLKVYESRRRAAHREGRGLR